jgi:isoleucyl-tRNA synthetase
LTAVNVGLFGQSPFKNLICLGLVNAADGKKLSKKLKNYTDPNELMDMYSADSLRMLFLGSPLLNGENFELKDREVSDMNRKLAMIWNMYDFFTMYAEVDGWEWDGDVTDPSSNLSSVLDTWIISRLHELQKEVDENMQKYDLPSALKPVMPFIDDASNWFVRRSRKRFWKSDNDNDKNDAYKTLHFVLVRLAVILAPFTPFLAEELYQKLTGGESVHLLDWPESGHINELTIKNMATVRELITEGLAQRAQAGIKVRQPLLSADLVIDTEIPKNELEEYKTILLEELNIKKVSIKKGNQNSIKLNTKITKDLKLEGLSRDVIRQVQEARKKAGLEISDRIFVALKTTDKELAEAIKIYENEICSEALAQYKKELNPDYEIEVQLNNKSLTIGLKKR